MDESHGTACDAFQALRDCTSSGTGELTDNLSSCALKASVLLHSGSPQIFTIPLQDPCDGRAACVSGAGAGIVGVQSDVSRAARRH